MWLSYVKHFPVVMLYIVDYLILLKERKFFVLCYHCKRKWENDQLYPLKFYQTFCRVQGVINCQMENWGEKTLNAKKVINNMTW